MSKEHIPPPWSKPADAEPWKWKPGQSGNPNGRPLGAKNKKTLVGEALEKRAEAVADAVVDAALDGDMAAAKLVLERVKPPLRNENPRVEFDLSTERPLAEQGSEVLKAVSLGKLDPVMGKLLIDCLSAVGGLREHDQFGARLAALEQEVRDNRNDGAQGGVLRTGNPV